MGAEDSDGVETFVVHTSPATSHPYRLAPTAGVIALASEMTERTMVLGELAKDVLSYVDLALADRVDQTPGLLRHLSPEGRARVGPERLVAAAKLASERLASQHAELVRDVAVSLTAVHFADAVATIVATGPTASAFRVRDERSSPSSRTAPSPPRSAAPAHPRRTSKPTPSRAATSSASASSSKTTFPRSARRPPPAASTTPSPASPASRCAPASRSCSRAGCD